MKHSVYILFLTIIISIQPFNFSVAKERISSITVKGEFGKDSYWISEEVKSIIFLQEKGNVVFKNNPRLYSFILQDEYANKIGRKFILFAPVNSTDYDHIIPDSAKNVELELYPVTGCDFTFYNKKQSPTPLPEYNRHWCGTEIFFSQPDPNAKAFEEFFWENPDKPQYVPTNITSPPLDYKRIPRLIELLDSDIQIKQTTPVRENLHKEVPLKGLVYNLLKDLEKLKLSTPTSDNKEEWQVWYENMNTDWIKREKPDIELKQLKRENEEKHTNYLKQDSIYRFIHYYEICNDNTDYKNTFFLDTDKDKFIKPEEETLASKAKHLIWNYTYPTKLIEFVKSQFPPKQTSYYYIPVSNETALVAIIKQDGFYEKLVLQIANSRNNSLSKELCIYTSIPTTEKHIDYGRVKIYGMFRKNEKNYIIIQKQKELIWLIINDSQLPQ